jgi:hypothetical protein
MTAPSIPLVLTAAEDARISSALGFDPGAASIKAEVHHILQTQAAIAVDPTARTGSGYRETPLENVPIPPGLPKTTPSASGSASQPKGYSGTAWTFAAIAAAVVLAWGALRITRRPRP